MRSIEAVSPGAPDPAEALQSSAETPTRPELLVVGDTPFNSAVLPGLLSSLYTLTVAGDGETALLLAQSQPQPVLILLEVRLPGIDGFEVCRRLKLDEQTRDIPVVFLTGTAEIDDQRRGFEAGAVDCLITPLDPSLLQLRLAAPLRQLARERELSEQLRLRTQELESTRLDIIRRLGRAAEFKDDETGQHIIRMSHYARLLAEAAGLSAGEVELLFNAAPMHDIGKIGIPEAILLKSGPLTEDEWKVMAKHPAIGASIIGRHQHPLLDTARIVALTHHEKWDGSGYPRGLSGEQIPLVGRIVAIADVFDALTSERPYKQAWPVQDAVAYLRTHAGSHFDPDLVELFIGRLPEVLKVGATNADQSKTATLATYVEDFSL